MKIIKDKDASRFKNSDGCIATEYAFDNESDFNIAGIELKGRYPEQGYALNTISKELIYVKDGSGTLITEDISVDLHPGDTALIQPHEKYYLERALNLIISSAPAWHPEQHQNVME